MLRKIGASGVCEGEELLFYHLLLAGKAALSTVSPCHFPPALTQLTSGHTALSPANYQLLHTQTTHTHTVLPSPHLSCQVIRVFILTQPQPQTALLNLSHH